MSAIVHTCDHCDCTVDSYWPSGGDDLICKKCFDKYCRDQEEDESWEDYKGRHPHYDCMGELSPLTMAKRFFKSVKEHCPELWEVCVENHNILRKQVWEDHQKLLGRIAILQDIIDNIEEEEKKE